MKLKYVVVSRASEASVLSRLDDSHGAHNGTSAVDGKYFNFGGSVSYAMTLHRLGTVYFRIGDKNTATACLSSALRIQREYLGSHHFTVAKTLVDLASALRNTEGKKDEARICYTEAYEIRKLRNRNDADVGHILYHIGQLYDAKNDYARATVLYSQALQTYGRRYVNAVSRQICQQLFLRKFETIDADDATNGDLLTQNGLHVASIEESDDMIIAQFSTISRALGESVRMRIRSMDTSIMMNLDVHAPDCLITLEMYLLSLFGFIRFLSGEFAQRTTRFVEHSLQQIESLGAEGMKTSQDAIVFQMLYLIPE